MKAKIYYLLLIVCCFSCKVQQPESTPLPTEVVHAEAYSLRTTLGSDFSTNYLQFLPKDYEEKDNWPLLLFLHGAGERGDDLAKVAIQGPPKLAAQGQLEEFIVIAPQCPLDDYWDTWKQQTGLVALLEHLEQDLKIDSDRIYVTGLSMGGFGTWHLASAIPDKIAAAVPICGGGNVWTADDLSPVPIWAFHGAKDDVVPLSSSQEMVDAVKTNGGTVKFTVYPEADHNSWDQAYESTPELYEWILTQNLANRSKK